MVVVNKKRQNTVLANAVNPNKPLAGQTVKVIKAVADTIGKTPGQVLDDLLKLLIKETKLKWIYHH
ncbi:MAG TPA: hypothetical protein DCP87_01760 [Lactobacillus sp.]|nr:hypothetical protein [Lactobacillus sp.]